MTKKQALIQAAIESMAGMLAEEMEQTDALTPEDFKEHFNIDDIDAGPIVEGAARILAEASDLIKEVDNNYPPDSKEHFLLFITLENIKDVRSNFDDPGDEREKTFINGIIKHYECDLRSASFEESTEATDKCGREVIEFLKKLKATF